MLQLCADASLLFVAYGQQVPKRFDTRREPVCESAVDLSNLQAKSRDDKVDAPAKISTDDKRNAALLLVYRCSIT